MIREWLLVLSLQQSGLDLLSTVLLEPAMLFQRQLEFSDSRVRIKVLSMELAWVRSSLTLNIITAKNKVVT